MSSVKPRASTEAVHDALRADLLGGQYRPGEKLKFAPLCERYGASVSVAREALTRLVEQGLVESEPRIGFRVRSVSLDDLRDLTATRIDVETLALRYAIDRGDLAWEADVLAAHHRLERTPLLTSDSPARVSDDWESTHGCFHATLLAGGRNDWLLGIAQTLRHAAEFYRRWSQIKEPGRDVASEHRGILEATLDRDAELACERLRRHYERTATIVAEALQPS